METSRPKVEPWNQPVNNTELQYSRDNKRVLAGVLAIILGSLGVHKFVLGYNNEGFIILGATIVGYATLCILIGWFILIVTSTISLV